MSSSAGVSCATLAIRSLAGTSIAPWSDSSSPRTAANREDLPVPLRPTTPTRQPGYRVASTPERSSRSPRRRAKSRREIIAALYGAPGRFSLRRLHWRHILVNAREPPMLHDTSLITMLVGGFVLAFVLGALARRAHLSPLVGYLVAGIIAGPYTPGFVGDQELAPQLAEIGVILLMFGVGLHFSWRDLMSVRNIALPGALAQIAVATTLGWGMARTLGWSHGAGIVFGLSLSCASTVVLLRALEDRRLVETQRGRIAVGWLIVEDIACVLALVLMPALAGAMAGEDGGGLGRSLLATFAKVGAFVAIILLVGRNVVPWLLQRVAGTGSRELFTLCILAIALGVAFGSAALFDVSF